MERAEKILAHPLATDGKVTVSITAEFDPGTKEVIRVGFDHANLPEESWAHLALLERPIVFTEKDPTSINTLTGRIGREHPTLAGMLKPLRQSLAGRKLHMYIGASFRELEASDVVVAPPEQVAPDGTVTSIWTGPVGEMPPDDDKDNFIGDWYYANVFFNGCLWHSDDDKVAIWQEATDNMKAHIAKCAEIRAVGAVFFVRSLHRFIVEAREGGHQL